MIYTDGEYSCVYPYWDNEENEYEITAVWTFEKNYPEMPDYWHLESIEVTDQPRNGAVLDCSPNGNVWDYIEKSGVDIETVEEVDYYEP